MPKVLGSTFDRLIGPYTAYDQNIDPTVGKSSINQFHIFMLRLLTNSPQLPIVLGTECCWSVKRIFLQILFYLQSLSKEQYARLADNGPIPSGAFPFGEGISVLFIPLSDQSNSLKVCSNLKDCCLRGALTPFYAAFGALR